MLQKLPAELHTPTITVAVRGVVHRIWTKLAGSAVLSRYQRWQDRARILAFCIRHALSYCSKDMEYEKLLELAGEKPNGFLDNMIIASMKKFTAATDWSKNVSHGRSQARKATLPDPRGDARFGRTEFNGRIG